MNDVSPHLQHLTRLISDSLGQGKKTILLLDYDGTLVPLFKTLHEGVLSEEKKTTLKQLSEFSPWLEVYVVSGRDQEFLISQFGNTACKLFSEHASLFYDCKSKKSFEFLSAESFKSAPEIVQVSTIFEEFAPNIKDSYLEHKQFSIGFHYNEDVVAAESPVIKELLRRLINVVRSRAFKVSSLREVIEVRLVDCDKSKFLERLAELNQALPHRFIAFGDDLSDFEMFRSLREQDIKVAVGRQVAGFDYVASSDDVFKILRAAIN